MKRKVVALATAAVAAVLVSCGSIPVPGIGISLPGPSVGSTVASSSAGPVEFKSDEVLCQYGDRDVFDGVFYTARVLTPASAATKNQAEVLFVSDGKKAWTPHVIPSRKAEKADYAIGKVVFFLAGWEDHDEIGADSYRKDQWRLGRVTNTDELFKNRLEIDGEKHNPKYVRVPTIAVE